MHKLGIIEDATCHLCRNEVETMDHLFFRCYYSRRLLNLLGEKLGLALPHSDSVQWRLQMIGSQNRKNMVNAIYNACLYAVWQQRNLYKHETVLARPEKIIQAILMDLKYQFRDYIKNPIEARDKLLYSKVDNGG
ncbi:uncharacterized protein LOC141618480 [Silene latifolia]|uniref:uncharacterized protein LOC141618480 n=1 Tax=Silene latifolia TaxID=37657 RepID=UPI003D7772B3